MHSWQRTPAQTAWTPFLHFPMRLMAGQVVMLGAKPVQQLLCVSAGWDVDYNVCMWLEVVLTSGSCTLRLTSPPSSLNTTLQCLPTLLGGTGSTMKSFHCPQFAKSPNTAHTWAGEVGITSSVSILQVVRASSASVSRHMVVVTLFLCRRSRYFLWAPLVWQQRYQRCKRYNELVRSAVWGFLQAGRHIAECYTMLSRSAHKHAGGCNSF